MRDALPGILCLTLLLCARAEAQERQEVSNKSGTRNARTEEVYSVLKDDKTIKDGPYRLSRNDKVLISGYFSHGQRDSVWEAFNRNGFLVSRKIYSKGEKTGEWKFFNSKGDLEWTYDFNTHRASIQHISSPFTDTSHFYYQTDSGAWSPGFPDKPLLGLGGSGDWLSYLNNNFRYPDEAVNKGLQGKVTIRVTVDEQGTITDYSFEGHAAPSLDEEAMRVARLYPFEFIPAENHGRKIKAQFLVQMQFRLEVN